MNLEIVMYGIGILSVLGSYLVVKQNKWGFIVWTLTNASWIAYDIYKIAYPQAILFVVYFGMSVWGFIVWKKQKEKEQEKDIPHYHC
jgi:nicotinamide riboside transporter PnuC